jgi:hypothetical protein
MWRMEWAWAIRQLFGEPEHIDEFPRLFDRVERAYEFDAEAQCIDDARRRFEARLAPTAFVGAEDRCRDTDRSGDVGLRTTGTSSEVTQHGTGEHPEILADPLTMSTRQSIEEP